MRDWFLQVHKLSISHADSTTRSLLTGQSVSVYEQAAEPTEVNNRPYTHSHSHARTLARMITLIARPPLCCGAAHISATRTEPDTHTHTHTHTQLT
eukprot:COSAG06_NODE_15275_length_1084_cov_1.158376_2_plen_96_part_00